MKDIFLGKPVLFKTKLNYRYIELFADTLKPPYETKVRNIYNSMCTSLISLLDLELFFDCFIIRYENVR